MLPVNAMGAREYNVTVFPAFNRPIPCAEHIALDWEGVVRVYAGELSVINDKAKVNYCVPCLLKDAPFTGYTAEHMAKMGVTVGKQRTANHITEAKELVLDFDGLSTLETRRVFGAVRDLCGQYLVYSSYSHGSSEKPGARFRVVLGLDRALDGLAYTALWESLNSQLFEGLADKTSRQMYQQQGKWATNPVWSDKAFKYVGRGEPLCCDRWISNVSLNVTTPSAPSVSVSQLDLNKVRQALKWIDMTQYEHWMTMGTALKVLGEEDFERFWVDRSAPSDDARHDPQRIWDGLKPNMPAGAAIGTLLRMARDGATKAVNKCRGLTAYTPEGNAAAKYLQQKHPKHWCDLNKANQ